jgi:nucleotide-binding universal stress UspA family protein
MFPIRTILLPTDFSSCSDSAFRLACMLARDYGARLIVLHVAAPPIAVYGEGLLVEEPELQKQELWKALQAIKTDIPNLSVERRLAEGDAAAEILRVADETDCDLLVMGTHGRTGVGRFVLGSVAEQVMRRAHCPVLTTKVSGRASETEDAAGTAGSSVEAIASN